MQRVGVVAAAFALFVVTLLGFDEGGQRRLPVQVFFASLGRHAGKAVRSRHCPATVMLEGNGFWFLVFGFWLLVSGCDWVVSYLAVGLILITQLRPEPTNQKPETRNQKPLPSS